MKTPRSVGVYGAVFCATLAIASAAERPPAGVRVIPHGQVFRSMAEYEHSLYADDKSHDGTPIRSAELEIRSVKDNVQIARFAYPYEFAESLPQEFPMRAEGSETAFNDAHLRRMGALPPGTYRMALLLNGVRASNVVEITLDPDFDPAKAPTLQLGVLEPTPLGTRAELVLWAIGPTPPEKNLTPCDLYWTKIVVDGVLRGFGCAWSGPNPLIAYGERWAGTRTLERCWPAVDLAQKHACSVTFNGYETGTVVLDPNDRRLADAWEASSATLTVRPKPTPLLRGHVTDADGRTAKGHYVSLRTGRRVVAGEVTDASGAYAFAAVPPGRYLLCAGVPSRESYPVVREKVVLEAGKTAVRDLSLQKPYAFSGRVVDANGRPVWGVSLSARWKGFRGEEYSSQTDSERDGTFRLSGTFPEVSSVKVTSNDWRALPQVDVKSGDTDVTFVVVRRGEAMPPGQEITKRRARRADRPPSIDLEKVAARLGKGLNVNMQAEDGNTPLSAAARTGNLDLVRKLVAGGADVNAEIEPSHTVLRCAITSGNPEIVECLVSHGADVNRAFSRNETPLMEAARLEQVEIARLLINRGANMLACARNGSDALTEAVRNGHEEIIHLLASRGAELNRLDDDSMTPLMWAARAGRADAVKALIEDGADVHTANEDGFTALFMGSEGTNKEGHDYAGVVRLLLAAGADPNARAATGITPLRHATKYGALETMKALVAAGAEVRGNEAVRALAEVIRATLFDVSWNYPPKPYPGLSRAEVIRARCEALRTLLELGVDPNTEVEPGTSALFRAIETRIPRLVQILLEANANPNATHIEPGNETSALITAAGGEQAEMVRALIEAGANVDFKDDYGKTAADRARDPEIRRLLGRPN